MTFLFEDPCLGQQKGRRRGFWTTQIQACGSYFDVCGNACAVPGLEYIDFDIVPPLVITSSPMVSVPENAALAFQLTADKAVTWTIVGGADQTSFEIAGSTLLWVGNGSKDYESPTDANADNVYTVVVRATDSLGTSVDQTINVTVTDVLEKTLNALTLSASSIAENSVAGAVVGAIQGATAGSTLSLTDTAGGRFALSGSNIVAGVTATDYEIATSHSITLRETNADATNSPRDTVLSIAVTNVLEKTLGALTLSASTIVENSVAGAVVGAIQGATAGSTLSLTDTAGGRFALSGTNIVAGATATDYETATSHNITLREVIADATNSPRDTVLAIAVTNVLEKTLNALTLSASTIAENSAANTVVGAIQGATAGSTLSLIDTAGGRFAVSGTNIVAGATATDYETATNHSITIRETHGDATNSPRDTVLSIAVTNVLEKTLSALTLSASTIAENSAANTVIGAIQGGTAGSTFSLTDTAGNRFAISGMNIVAGATATDYETATSHSITIRETNVDATNSPRDTTVTVTVTNVLEKTLAALTLSANKILSGSASGTVVGDVLGRTSGAALTLTDDAGGRFVLNGSGQIIAGLVATNYSTATSHNVTLRESHADAANSPRDTTLAIAVQIALNVLSLSASSLISGSAPGTVVGTVQNTTSGSTLSLADNAGGRFAISGNQLVAGSVATDYYAAALHSVTLRETHVGGSNSPKDTTVAVTVIARTTNLDFVANTGVIQGGAQANSTAGLTVSRASTGYAYEPQASSTELLNSPGFDDPTKWDAYVAVTGSAIVSGGQASITPDGSGVVSIEQAIPTVPGRPYLVTVAKMSGATLVAQARTTARQVGGVTLGSAQLAAASGTFTFEFVATTTTTYIGYSRSSSTSGVPIVADSFSVKEQAGWISFAVNVARRTSQGLLIEEQRTNSLRNNSMQGAVAGTPGTLPTNWTITGFPGSQVVGTGSENGIDYIDLRVFGTTASTSAGIRFEGTAGVTAAAGQTWISSSFCRLVGGSKTNISSLQIETRGMNSGVANADSASTSIMASVDLASLTASRKSSPSLATVDAATTSVRPQIIVTFATGVAIDITLRIGWPQIEQGAWASSPIRTTNAAVTRNADVVSINPFPVTGEGTLFGQAVAPAGNVGTSYAASLQASANTNSVSVLQNSTQQVRTTVLSGGSTLFNALTSAWSFGTRGKVAVGFKAADYAASKDNSTPTTGNTAGALWATGTADRLNVGNTSNSSFWNGLIERISVYEKRLSNAEIQALTVPDAAELVALSLSASTIAENSTAGTVVGAILGAAAGSTLSLTDTAGSRFAISGSSIVAGATATDYETATSHNVTIRETLAGAVGSPKDTVLTVTVTNVLEKTLAALTLSANTISENSVAGTVVGAIQGATTGSTLTLTDTAGSRFAISGTNIVAGATATDYETATSHAITIRETHGDATNSPRDTTLTVSVLDVAEGAWTPAALSTDLVGWYDAQDAATITQAAGAVSQWKNKSTATDKTKDAVQATSATQPAYNANALGTGKAGLVFDGGNDWMDLSPLVGTGWTAMEVFYVRALNVDPPASSSSAASVFGADPNGSYTREPDSDGVLKLGTFSTVLKNTGVNPTPSLAVPRITSLRSASADFQYWIDGVQVYTTASNVFNAPSSAYIGAVEVGYYAGKAGEVVLVKRILTTLERQKMEGYLAYRWGLQANLPAGHPYKSSPP